MYLTMKQQVKQLTKEDYKNLKLLSHIAKNLANEEMCIRDRSKRDRKGRSTIN